MRKFSLILLSLFLVLLAHNAYAVAVTVTSPDGAEQYTTGQNVNINWNADAAPENIDHTTVEFSSNGGASHSLLGTVNGDVFTYAWNTPDLSSDNCQIRVTVYDDNGGSASDVSDASFTIAQPPTVTVITPNGAEELDNGVETTIVWSVNSVIDIAESVIELSEDNGNSWDQIGVTGVNVVTLDYTFNNVFSDECLIRVTAEDDLDQTGDDDSNAAFTVSTDPIVTVTAPDGGEELVEGENFDITWTVTAGQDIAESVIEFSSNNGGSWTPIGTTQDDDFEWEVPDVWSQNCLIRVTATGEFGYVGDDQSDAAFQVSPIPDVTVTFPNGGNEFVTGNQIAITWTVTGGPQIDDNDVAYSTNGGNSWIPIGTTQGNTFSLNWTIPNLYSETCLVRVVTTDEFDAEGSDLSNAAFRISNIPNVEVNFPDGGEALVEGTEISISWDVTTGGQAIDESIIEFSSDGGDNWAGIGLTEDDDFDFDWEVPGGINSDECLIRVTSTDEFGTSNTNVSDAEFQISQLVRVTVTDPDGGEVWITGQNQEITWHAWHGGGPEPEFAEHEVSYSIDGGTNWTVIDETQGVDFHLDWEIPNLYSTNCLVRVISTNEFETFETDVSDDPFTISPIPVVEVNTPNGGAVYVEDNQVVVEWDVTTGGQDINDCTVSLSTDNGQTYHVIGTTQGNDFTFDWDIPDLYSLQCLIRVTATDEYNTDGEDESDAVFTIAPIPDVEIADPNGGEHFIEAAEFEIQWSVTGGPQIDECLIELSQDNGNSWTEVTTTGVNDFDFDWTIPDVNSAICLLRVTATDEYGTSGLDVTNAVFQITPIPDVDITLPDGGEHYIEDTEVTFTWDLGPGPDIIENVVSFSADGGNSWTELGSTQNDDYDWAWTAPDLYALNCLIKVVSTDVHGTPGTGISEAAFGVSPIPDVEVIFPNGGQHVIEAEHHNVTWNVTGGPQIDENIISYSTNNGNNWTVVGSTQGADFDFDWTVPDAYSFTCLIKVTTTDEYGGTGDDVSDAVFTTTPIPDVVVLSPNGGQDFDSFDPTVVTWDVTSQPAIVSNEVTYSTDGGASWIDIGSTQNDDYDLDWQIPYLFDLYVVVKVTSTDEYGVVGYDISDNWFTIAFTHAEATLYRGWTILGLPLHPENGHKEVLIGGEMVNANPWDFFGFDMTTSFTRPDSLYCGIANLLTMFQDSITVDLTGQANRSLIEVELDRGWNLLGNPFPETIPVGDLSVRFNNEVYSIPVAADLNLVIPIFYEYENAQYVLADPLADWRGYWFLSLTEGVEMLIIPAPPGPVPTGLDDQNMGTFEAWQLAISATKDGVTDGLLTVGANVRATDGFDASFDYPDPPSTMVGNIVNTYFEEPRWLPMVGSHFNRHIREQMVDENVAWTFFVSTSDPGEVTLTWADIFATTPAGYEFEIVDVETGQRFNPRAQESYTYLSDGMREFTVRAFASLAAKERAQQVLPTEFALNAVYPNPFNNFATVGYDLPQAAQVSIKLYDLNGNLVSQLVNGFKAAGRYEAVLNADDLAGGIYFIKLTSSDFTSIKKAVLVK